MEAPTSSIRVIRAKVVEERFHGEDRQPRRGTKHFRGGAKVYVIDGYWGSCDSVTVIGHHRGGGRYVKLDMPVEHLSDFRMDTVYSPKVIALVQQHYADRPPYTEAYGEDLLRVLPEWKKLWERSTGAT